MKSMCVCVHRGGHLNRFKVYGRIKKDTSGTSEIVSSVMYKRFRTRRNHWARVTYPYKKPTTNPRRGPRRGPPERTNPPERSEHFCKCATGEAMDGEDAHWCRERTTLTDDAFDSGQVLPINKCVVFIVSCPLLSFRCDLSSPVSALPSPPGARHF